jgi:hypothetical protein
MKGELGSKVTWRFLETLTFKGIGEEEEEEEESLAFLGRGSGEGDSRAGEEAGEEGEETSEEREEEEEELEGEVGESEAPAALSRERKETGSRFMGAGTAAGAAEASRRSSAGGV